jgi:Ca-activated chloride channel family protein
VSRVILLSDGQANRGEIRANVIASECSAWLEKGVTTTTVGLGRHFNEDLMIAMAHADGEVITKCLKLQSTINR